MKIGGFQKFSLLDYPQQIAAIIFTQGCNFRCSYCHNPQLVDPTRYAKPLHTARIMEFLKHRKGKLGAVSISGGEPTYQPDIIKYVTKLKNMGYLIKLDTNGSLPLVVKELAEKELVDYWAMDIKAPLDLYPVITHSDFAVENILQSMDILRSSGKEYEFRTTYFDKLFSWNDVSRIQEMLCPGDKFFLQECRYADNLEDFTNSAIKTQVPQSSEYLHLQDDPACQSLIRWGDQHQVSVHIRSL